MQRLIAAFVSMLFAASGLAAPITYDVSRQIGVGTVTGTVTTDGAVGALSAADIVDFDLRLFDGTDTATIDGPTAGQTYVGLGGSGVVASLSQLTFDFDVYGYLFFLAPSTTYSRANEIYCLNGILIAGCAESASEGVSAGAFPTVSEAASGTLVFATAEPIGATVPEPASPALLVLGGTAGLMIGRRIGALRRPPRRTRDARPGRGIASTRTAAT